MSRQQGDGDPIWSGARVSDVLVRAAVPVLFMLMGWVGNSLFDHSERIASIEASRYTAEMARRDRQEMRRELGTMADQPWLRERIENVLAQIKQVDERVKRVETRLERIEDK